VVSGWVLRPPWLYVTLPACPSGVGKHWEGPGLRRVLRSYAGQYKMELVVAVALKVQRQVQRRYQVIFEFPRRGAYDPADGGVL